MTQKDKLKLLVLGKSNPQLALLSFMEQVDSEMKTKMEEDHMLMRAEMMAEMERKVKEVFSQESFKKLEMIKGEKGDEGYTPQVGKDYYTDEDIKTFSDEIMSQVRIPKDGDVGERGERGEQGEKGERGDVGAQGEKGEQGERGEIGERGVDGKDGKNGIDANEKKLKDEIIEWLNKLRTIKSGKGGGGMGNVITQSFSVSSATTTITLSNGVASGGSALWLNYNGQQQQKDVQFTSNGGTTITLLFTPADNTYIDVIYIRS